MPHHHAKNTESVPAWCNQCWRMTQHAVSGGRQGRCLEHDAPRTSVQPAKNDGGAKC